jgi:hypothetical protein
LADCGCLAGERCRHCARTRHLVRRDIARGRAPRTIAARRGLSAAAVELEACLEGREQADARYHARQAARREEMIAAFDLTGLAASRVRKGNALPNRPLRDEWERRATAHEQAIDAQETEETFLSRMVRLTGSESSKLQRALGLRPDSRSAKTTARRDGSTRARSYGGSTRQTISVDLAEQITRAWGTDPDALINDHPLIRAAGA